MITGDGWASAVARPLFTGWDLRFRAPGFGFRVLGFGFRVWGFGILVLGFGFECVGFVFCISGVGFTTQVLGFGVSGSGFRGSGLLPKNNGRATAEAHPSPVITCPIIHLRKLVHISQTSRSPLQANPRCRTRSSHIMYLSIKFRKLTPLHNRRLDTLISNVKQ